MTNNKATSLLRKGVPLMLTHTQAGPLYSIDGHGTVATRLAKGLTEANDGPGQLDLFLVPNDDGLFPGFSQTWQAAS